MSNLDMIIDGVSGNVADDRAVNPQKVVRAVVNLCEGSVRVGEQIQAFTRGENTAGQSITVNASLYRETLKDIARTCEIILRNVRVLAGEE